MSQPSSDNQAQPGPAPHAHPRGGRHLRVEDYVQGVLERDRAMLARTITLIESQAPAHRTKAQAVLQALLPRTGKARRVGISGVPGAGKSTFIEALGSHLCEQQHQVAVLTVDPTSSLTGGSILGDKTRMDRLSRHPQAFIRPTPSGAALGGVAWRTRETMLVCEAAGFDVILVETVGVGQSEVTVRSMVDYFLLLLLPGGGDELQGIKKGIVELADGVLINKADGANRMLAEQARAEYSSALHYLTPATPGWRTEVGLCSALTGDGIASAWDTVLRFYRELEPKEVIRRRRDQQNMAGLETLMREELPRRFFCRRHGAAPAGVAAPESAARRADGGLGGRGVVSRICPFRGGAPWAGAEDMICPLLARRAAILTTN